MAPSQLTRRSTEPIRVVLSSPALQPFTGVWRAAAAPVAELSIAGFFISAVTVPVLGNAAPWFVLAAGMLAAVIRGADIERLGLLLPGGLVNAVQEAFGLRSGTLATATLLAERVLVGALAAVVIGHYAVSAITTLIGRPLTGIVEPEDPAIVVALVGIGALWIRARLGRQTLNSLRVAWGIWAGVGVLVVVMIWAVLTVFTVRAPVLEPLLLAPRPLGLSRWPFIDTPLVYLIGIALSFSAVGGSEALARCIHELAPPRIQALRRVGILVATVGTMLTTLGAFLFIVLTLPADQSPWLSAPLIGLSQALAGPVWLKSLAAVAVAAAAALMLLPIAGAALAEIEHTLQRSSFEGLVPGQIGVLHRQLGTPTRAIDASAAAVVVTILACGGRLPWLGRAYGICLAVMVLLKIATVIRLRKVHPGSRPYFAPLNLRIGGRVVPVGLAAAGLIVAAGALAMFGLGDVASIAPAGSIVALGAWLAMTSERSHGSIGIEDPDTFDLLSASDLSLNQVEARPGNVLVPVRNPNALSHVEAALRTAGDRDIVIMTVRLEGVDLAPPDPATTLPTPQERRLLSAVMALCEAQGRSVRLLIVPARSVFDAIIDTIVRLRSSEVYVGESTSLSADDQARLLGESWERADTPDQLSVRLVVCHRSGRSDLYHLGAHSPTLSPTDLELLHRLWLDAVRTVGPHLHHHDIVRAALTQMEEQLSGPQRDAALAAIREVARPAEELAAVVRASDYTRLRDMLRNRDASDVASLLTTLSREEQVVVFRVLPREDAAAVFEYLSQEDKETLLKGMAQEDVAALINNMAPDDRTVFLEELPAEATRQLLALLTTEERAIAVTLLGYPEGSVGRLMTPNYVAVREQWSVREVLDYVREHGQDSETLNHVYTLNEHGLLIDDMRIREFLLAPLTKRVADLMDRRFVALKATDSQEEAVAVFKQNDRTALPVTDSAGMLIGIVTIDDVLDVAEATATRDIQRIGGSEALDEPYITIALSRMIWKRAGWLMALFIGELLTATAMGAFEAEISKAVVLAFFVPLIISSGGNSGSQAATLVIRALALGEVGLHDWWRVMKRELVAGLALGSILGTIGFLRITLWSAFSDIYGPHWLLVALTVAVSLVGVVLWGTLSGSLLPFVLKRLGFDPAASSAPFVATLVDVTGLVIYFTAALVILKGTLL